MKPIRKAFSTAVRWRVRNEIRRALPAVLAAHLQELDELRMSVESLRLHVDNDLTSMKTSLRLLQSSSGHNRPASTRDRGSQ